MNISSSQKITDQFKDEQKYNDDDKRFLHFHQEFVNLFDVVIMNDITDFMSQYFVDTLTSTLVSTSCQ